jgi:pyridoxine 5''-phosphate synthase
MPATHQRLYINVDHVATLRQARRTDEPDPVAAAALCEDAGAEGITAHLREDRRHMQDDDIIQNRKRGTYRVQSRDGAHRGNAVHSRAPEAVPDHSRTRAAEEVTTEGGLDVAREPEKLRDGLARLKRAGVRTSLFIDPDGGAVQRSRDLGADAIELHTGTYAHDPSNTRSLRALADASELGRSLGLAVHAGHGLTVRNVGPVAAIAAIEELNIGHSIVSRAIFVGLAQSIAEMREAMLDARGAAR